MAMKQDQYAGNKLRTLLQGIPRLGLAALLLIPMAAWGQRTVNASGGSGNIGGDVYAYSIGELTRVGTATGGNLTVTEGVLQGSPDTGSGIGEATAGDVMRLWPNPVEDLLYLQPALPGGGELTLRLLDDAGHQVMAREIQLGAGTEQQQIDMASLAVGTYFLTATLRNGDRHYRKTFKVMKAGAGR